MALPQKRRMPPLYALRQTGAFDARQTGREKRRGANRLLSTKDMGGKYAVPRTLSRAAPFHTDR